MEYTRAPMHFLHGGFSKVAVVGGAWCDYFTANRKDMVPNGLKGKLAMSFNDKQVTDLNIHMERARAMRAEATRSAFVAIGNWMTGRSKR